MVRQWYSGVALFFLASACNVKDPLLTTGGVTLDDGGVAEASALDGADGPDGSAQANAPCAKAMVVSSSDYSSTNISLLSPLGAILSESFISSGSASTGLSTALSGDVILPLEVPPSGRVVLLDRYPNSVLTWVDVASASVLGQLPVRTGFFSNPQDYLELPAHRAYVSRFETNASPGAMPYDGGGDVLIIDTQSFAITGRIDLATPSDGAFQPRPSHLLRMGTEVWVVLQRLTADFSDAADARVVGIDTQTDQIAWTLDLPNVANCQGFARSPSGSAVALSCPGIGGRSAVVLLDATAHPPTEQKRFDVVAALTSKPGSPLSFASETLLVGATQGDSMAGLNDVAYTLDTASGSIAPLFDSGAAFSLGDVRCAPGCTDLCFIADATANALRVWKIQNNALVDPSTTPVDPSIGLPPRAMGAL